MALRIRVVGGEFGLPTKKGPPRYTKYFVWLFPLHFLLFCCYAAWRYKGGAYIPPYSYPLLGFKWLCLRLIYSPVSPETVNLMLWRFLPSLLFTGFLYRRFTMQKVEDKAEILRGSAHFATLEEIKSAALLQETGAVIGGFRDRNKKLHKLLHSGPEHILVCAPTRSGKGVSLVVPTLLTWQESVFVLDIKGENYVLSAGYRKKLGNVIKFEPTASGDETARYNPLLEVHLDVETMEQAKKAQAEENELAAREGREPRIISPSYTEVRDVQNIAQMIVDPDGKGMDGPDSHWQKTAYALLQGLIVHTLYVNRRLRHSGDPKVRETTLGLDYVADVLRRCGDNRRLAASLLTYPHLAGDEERDLLCPDTPMPDPAMYKKKVLLESGDVLERDADPNYRYYHACPLDGELPHELTQEEQLRYAGGKNALPLAHPYCHPTVRQAAEEIGQKDVREASSVISTAIAYFGLWMDPTIQKNTRTSTFKLLDLVNQEKPTSLYLVVPPSDLTRLRPLLRLVVSQLVDALTQKMDAAAGGGVKSKNKHQILLMLDEFPTLRRLDKIQLGLAYMGGYKVKAFIICRSLRQLTDIYGKDETISANCHIHVFFAPNDEDTARMLSERCGETTVVTSGFDTSDQPFKFGLSESLSTKMLLETRKLLTADEIKRLTPPKKDAKGLIVRPGAMLILVAGISTIFGEQTPYFFDPEWKVRYKILPPDKSDVLYRPEGYSPRKGS